MKKLIFILIAMAIICGLVPLCSANQEQGVEPDTSWFDAYVDNVSVSELVGFDALSVSGSFHKNSVFLAKNSSCTLPSNGQIFIQVKEEYLDKTKNIWKPRHIYLVPAQSVNINEDKSVNGSVYGLKLDLFRYTLTMHLCPTADISFYSQEKITKQCLHLSDPVSSIWKSSGPVVYYKNFPKGIVLEEMSDYDQEFLGSSFTKDSVTFFFNDHKKQEGEISMVEAKVSGPGIGSKKVYRSFSKERVIPLTLKGLRPDSDYVVEIAITDYIRIRKITKNIHTLASLQE